LKSQRRDDESVLKLNHCDTSMWRMRRQPLL
jgi:hypothetical protein